MMMPLSFISLTFFLVLLIAVASVASTDATNEQVYNNELFPRDSLYGRVQENLMATKEMQEVRQFLGPGVNQNGQGLFSTNPFTSILNRLPIRRNPEFSSFLSTYDSCKAPDGEMGLCLAAPACTVIGGRASGSCNIGSVCCINAVSKCSGTITMNNTYWQTPVSAVVPQTTCAVTVRLDQNLPEQKKQPICQVRLDFIAFTIAQPDAQTVCATDYFQASGASNRAPTICGDNNDQHMYLHVQSTARRSTDIQLTFTFGVGVIPRSWNIRITMIPCGATYAAPNSCLQFFTGGSGIVKSFNWIDIAPGDRQLANQDYSICFRNELVNNKRANAICFQVCAVVAAGARPFRLSGNADTAQGVGGCATDYLVILDGEDPNAVAPTNRADRYCGGRLNPTTEGGPPPTTAGTSVQVCTKARPFRLHYRTNAAETAGTDAGNVGFCLNYMQRLQ